MYKSVIGNVCTFLFNSLTPDIIKNIQTITYNTSTKLDIILTIFTCFPQSNLYFSVFLIITVSKNEFFVDLEEQFV
jgi:hypothetical protein